VGLKATVDPKTKQVYYEETGRDPRLSTPVGDVTSTERGSGARANGGKTRFDLVPLHLLRSTADVFEYGAAKYSAWNWAKGMAWSVPYACAMRHLTAWYAGEELDEESGQTHLAHAMCNLLMLEHYRTHYPEGDDRPMEFRNDN